MTTFGAAFDAETPSPPGRNAKPPKLFVRHTHLWARPAAALIALVAVASCMDSPTVATAKRGVRVHLAFVPKFAATVPSRALAAAAATGLVLNNVRITVVRPQPAPTPPVTLKDTVITFSLDHADTTVDLSVSADPNEELHAGMQYRADATVLFDGSVTVIAHAAGAAPGAPPTVQLGYVGPGKNAATIAMTPNGGVFSPKAPLQLSYSVFDSSGAAIASVPVVWHSSDTTIATVGEFTGLVTFTGKTGSSSISVGTLTNITTHAAFTAAQASSIAIVSGNGQTDTVNKALALPFVVKVADQIGNVVSGVTVNWTHTGRGALAGSTSTTGADGVASMSYTLGDSAHTDTITATVAGVATPAVFTATAVASVTGVGIVTGFATIAVTPASATMKVGDTLTVTAAAVDASGKATSITPAWATSNPGLASITASGLVTALSAGTVTITATYQGVAGHSTLTVNP